MENVYLTAVRKNFEEGVDARDGPVRAIARILELLNLVHSDQVLKLLDSSQGFYLARRRGGDP
jgi:hypothetical protein